MDRKYAKNRPTWSLACMVLHGPLADSVDSLRHEHVAYWQLEACIMQTEVQPHPHSHRIMHQCPSTWSHMQCMPLFRAPCGAKRGTCQLAALTFSRTAFIRNFCPEPWTFYIQTDAICFLHSLSGSWHHHVPNDTWHS